MMKKLLVLLACLLLVLPVAVQAEEALPEGWRVEDFGDFTMPIAPNAMLRKFEVNENRDYVAEILYLDAGDPAFQPYMVIWWFDSNLSVYYERLHPLDYGKYLTADLVAAYEEDGCTVTDARTVYGMRRGQTTYTMTSMHIADNSWYANEPHDLWIYQRFYGTYDMGTYIFEIYGPTRAHVDAIVKDVEQVVYKK